MSRAIKSEVDDVVNTAEGAGAAVELPPPLGPAEGDKFPGGRAPEDRPSIPAVGPAYQAPPSEPGAGSRG